MPISIDTIPDPSEAFEVTIEPYSVKLKRELQLSKTIVQDNPDGIQFSWKVTLVEPTILRMEVDLVKPYEISVGDTVHVLSIKSKKHGLFKTTEGKQLEEPIDFSFKLSAQAKADAVATVQSMQAMGNAASQGSLIMSILIALLKAGSASFLFSMIGSF